MQRQYPTYALTNPDGNAGKDLPWVLSRRAKHLFQQGNLNKEEQSQDYLGFIDLQTGLIELVPIWDANTDFNKKFTYEEKSYGVGFVGAALDEAEQAGLEQVGLSAKAGRVGLIAGFRLKKGLDGTDQKIPLITSLTNSSQQNHYAFIHDEAFLLFHYDENSSQINEIVSAIPVDLLYKLLSALRKYLPDYYPRSKKLEQHLINRPMLYQHLTEQEITHVIQRNMLWAIKRGDIGIIKRIGAIANAARLNLLPLARWDHALLDEVIASENVEVLKTLLELGMQVPHYYPGKLKADIKTEMQKVLSDASRIMVLGENPTADRALLRDAFVDFLKKQKNVDDLYLQALVYFGPMIVAQEPFKNLTWSLVRDLLIQEMGCSNVYRHWLQLQTKVTALEQKANCSFFLDSLHAKRSVYSFDADGKLVVQSEVLRNILADEQSPLSQFILYIKDNLSNHPNTPAAISVLEALLYVKAELNTVACHFKREVRHPETKAVIDLTAYQSKEEAVYKLSRFVHDIEEVVGELIKNNSKMIPMFVHNIRDIPVGSEHCMDAALTVLKQTGGKVITLETLMSEYVAFTAGKTDNYIGALDFFGPRIKLQLPVSEKDKNSILNWQMVHAYFQNHYAHASFKNNWRALYQLFAKPVIRIERKGGMTTYCLGYGHPLIANRVLAYMASVLPEGYQAVLLKAIIRKENDLYLFKLPHDVYLAYVQINEPQTKKLTRQHSPLEHLLPDAVLQKDPENNERFFLCFKSEDEAARCVEEFKKLDITKFARYQFTYAPQYHLTPYQIKLHISAFNHLRNSYMDFLKREHDPKKVLGDDYFLKSIRADANDYFDDFKYTVTRSVLQQIKFPLRRGKKKTYTVDGTGVHLRADKKPLYAPEVKATFSQPQSTSYVFDDLIAPVFGFATRDTLTGVLIAPSEVLLSNRIYRYDGGTVDRRFEFDDEKSAMDHYQAKVTHKDRVLFSNKEMAEFKVALKAPEMAGKYSEALVRMRFNPEKGYIFKATEGDSSAMLVLYRAKVLRERLLAQAKENNAASAAQAPIYIVNYAPGRPHHLAFYDIFSQLEERWRVANKFKSEAERKKSYAEKKYDFVYAFADTTLILQDKVNGYPILIEMLKDGYNHPARYVLGHAIPPAPAYYNLNTDDSRKYYDALLSAIHNTARKKDKISFDLLKRFIAETKELTLQDVLIDALSYSAQSNFYEANLAVEFLLTQDVELEKVKVRSEPFIIFILARYSELAPLILSKAKSPHLLSHFGMNLLQCMINRSTQWSFIDVLLSFHISPFDGLSDGSTVLDRLITFYRVDQSDLIEKLIEFMARFEKGGACFYKALKNLADNASQNDKLIDCLAYHIKDFSKFSIVPLINNKNISALEEVFKKPFNPDLGLEDGVTPLIAAIDSLPDIIPALIKEGANVNLPDANNNALLRAASCIADGDLALETFNCLLDLTASCEGRAKHYADLATYLTVARELIRVKQPHALIALLRTMHWCGHKIAGNDYLQFFIEVKAIETIKALFEIAHFTSEGLNAALAQVMAMNTLDLAVVIDCIVDENLTVGVDLARALDFAASHDNARLAKKLFPFLEKENENVAKQVVGIAIAAQDKEFFEWLTTIFPVQKLHSLPVLAFAIEHYDEKKCQQLLAAGANVDNVAVNITPLSCAVKKRYYDLARDILNAKPNSLAALREEKNVFEWAITCNGAQFLPTLIASFDNAALSTLVIDKKPALISLTKFGYFTEVKQLLAKGVSLPNSPGNVSELFFVAMRLGQYDLIEMFINHGILLNDKESLLSMAILTKDLGAIQNYAFDARVTDKARCKVLNAIACSLPVTDNLLHMQIILQSLSTLKGVRIHGVAPLEWALIYCRELIPQLLALGARPDATDGVHPSPLELAISHIRKEEIKLFLTQPITAACLAKGLFEIVSLVNLGFRSFDVIELFLTKWEALGNSSADYKELKFIVALAVKAACFPENLLKKIVHLFDVDGCFNGKAPITWAIEAGNLTYVNLLLASQAKVYSHEEAAAAVAIRCNRFQIFERLMAHSLQDFREQQLLTSLKPNTDERIVKLLKDIIALKTYRFKRSLEKNYAVSEEFKNNRLFKSAFRFDKETKLSAVEAMLQVRVGAPIALLDAHQEALNQGRLKDLYRQIFSRLVIQPNIFMVSYPDQYTEPSLMSPNGP